MFAIPDHSIPIIPLPEHPFPPQRGIDFLCRKTFPQLDHVFQHRPWSETEEHMNMVRHHHERIDRVAFAIKVQQGIGNNFGDGWILEDTFTASSVQPMVDAFGKHGVILLFRCSAPRLRVLHGPLVSLPRPFLKLVRRQAVGETPRDKKTFLALLPMGQMKGFVFLNFQVWIQVWRTRGRDAHTP